MYKYIIYCSVSAAIIIACKYLYQHWIRQNHTIANLKQELGLLNDKVKRLETELERNKNSISGGVKIPIVFKPIENRLITPPSSPKVIQLFQDEPSLESRGSSSVNEQLVVLEENQNASRDSTKSNHTTRSNNSIKSQKELELEEMTANLEKEVDNISLSELKDEDVEDQQAEQIVIEKSDNVKKNYKKKSLLPDAKDYNNGERVTDENGVEHICVVGKRGGHSWKKL
jgi:hypothetical protein